MTPEQTPPPVRPRSRKAANANGAHEPIPLNRDPAEPTDADLAEWSRGATALARMPASWKLKLLDSVDELRRGAQAEIDGKRTWIERLKYETEEMLASGIGARLGVQPLASISMEAPPPMLLERLDPTGHTVLFGTGGTGKGVIASEWTLRLARAGHRVLIVDYENHPTEWARRIYSLGGSDLLGSIMHVAPLTARWGGQRGAIWHNADDLHQLATDFGATYLVIDSIVPACVGTDPLKPEAVAQYAGALERIGRPALSLGHVTKSDDLRYPFGSVFWHNLSRVTWSAKRSGEQVLLTHRKHNNYERQAPLLMTFEWYEGMPINALERSAAEELSQRIVIVLRDGPLTARQISDRLDEDLDEDDEPTKIDSVSRALRRGQKDQPARFVRVGSDRWNNG